VPSIFEIERRTRSLFEEQKRLDDLLLSQEFYLYGNNRNIVWAISETFINWPHRGLSLGLTEYFQDLGINFRVALTDEQCLLYFEFIYNYLQWFKSIKSSSIVYRYLSEQAYYEITQLLPQIENQIKRILELSNFSINLFPDNTFRIMKRDTDLDSVIMEVNDESIRYDLLSYLDFRNENNLTEKKSIITRLYVYLEQNISIQKYSHVRFRLNPQSPEIDPYDNFFYICNTFKVRHGKDEGKKKQIVLPDDETIELCDIAYYMFLQAHRIPIMSEFDLKLKQLKEKHNK